MDWPGVEFGPLQQEAGDRPPVPWKGTTTAIRLNCVHCQESSYSYFSSLSEISVLQFYMLQQSPLFQLRNIWQNLLAIMWLSRYSDWLRAGRSGDRIPVGARFSAPVQTGLGAHPASCTLSTGSFPGVESGRGVTLTPHPLLVPRSKTRAELYLYSP
jgi:hypothetical protein